MCDNRNVNGRFESDNRNVKSLILRTIFKLYYHHKIQLIIRFILARDFLSLYAHDKLHLSHYPFAIVILACYSSVVSGSLEEIFPPRWFLHIITQLSAKILPSVSKFSLLIETFNAAQE